MAILEVYYEIQIQRMVKFDEKTQYGNERVETENLYEQKFPVLDMAKIVIFLNQSDTE